MLQFPVGISIEAIDNATAKTRQITAGLVKATKPLTRFQAAFKGLGEAAGFPKLMAGFRGVGDALGGLVDSAKRATLLIGGVTAAAGAALFALVRGYAAAGDSAVKAAQKIGISVEALQELRYAGDLANVEAEELDASLIKLTRNAALAARGQRSAAKPFERLGIAVKDSNGHIRNAGSLIAEIADKFGRLDDPLKKAALAQELFGKTGANLIPLLSEGSAGLARAAAEARRFGIVLSKEDAAAGEEFMDGLTRVGAALRGVRNAMGRELLPVLEELAKRFREWLVENLPAVRDFARRLAQDLPAALERARAGFMKFWNAIEPVRKVLALLYDLLGPVGVAIATVATVLVVSLIPAIASTIAALVTLSTALVSTPAGWVVLALTAIVAAFAAVTAAIVLLIANWDSISERFPRLAGLAKTLGIALVLNFLGPILLVVAALEKLLELAENLTKKVPDWVFKLAGVDIDAVKAGEKRKEEAGSKPPEVGVAPTSGPASDFAAAMRDLRMATDEANKARPGAAPLARAIAGDRLGEGNETTVHVDFSNLPKGSKVSTESKGEARVDLQMGYALSGP